MSTKTHSDMTRERSKRRARIRRGQDPDMVVDGPYHVNAVPPSMADRREYFKEYNLHRTKESWE